MLYKTITQKSYQATAKEFAKNVADLAPLESIQRFVDLLPPHAKIIDIGCGSGRDAKIFNEKGISVTGIDFCPNLIEIARAHAPSAQFHVMDIETTTFPDSSFDGAWACCSLLHLPKKNFPFVLNKIYSFLKNQGYFYLALKKGEGEILEKDLRYGDFEKFWSFFTEKEIVELVQSAKFKILECCTIEKKAAYHSHPALRLFCQKD